MNFIKEYGLTLGLVVVLFGIIASSYYYFGIYIPHRDAAMIAETQRQEARASAAAQHVYDAQTALDKKQCENIEEGNRRTLNFQIISCGNDQSCIDYARSTILIGTKYIDTCMNLKRMGHVQ